MAASLVMRHQASRRFSALAAVALSISLVHCDGEVLPEGASSQLCSAIAPVALVGSCPEARSAARHGQPCNLPPTETCLWQQPGNFEVCACSCGLEAKWSCWGYGSDEPDCPTTLPSAGSECPYPLMTTCRFPGRTCRCSAEAVWTCEDEEPEELGCKAQDDASGPSGVEASVRVHHLSDADVDAWCAWYEEGAKGGKAVNPHPAQGGVVVGGETHDCGPLCIQHIAAADCARNLRLLDCDVPIGQLESCVRTLWNGCHRVGDGCDVLLRCERCRGVIVQATTDGCPVAVE